MIPLPRNLSQLNGYMCGPLNRKGLVCSECADGFGPSVTSVGYRCANCSETRYAVPFFLFLEFVPLTTFYLICLYYLFHIHVTSAPMPCFILLAQSIIFTFDSANLATPALKKVIPKEVWDHRLYIKVMLLLYRVFNLEFGDYVIPPYCLSSKLKFIHVAYLGYISAFYPPVLIGLTWVCVELHGRNFRPLVRLWRPFHRCFVRLRRNWNKKSDIIDVFTTFFLLSYGKIWYQTLILLTSDEITNINISGHHSTTRQCVIDQNITYGGTYHPIFAIPSTFIFIIFNMLPPLLLILYPIKMFRSCLSKCHLNSIVLNIFVDKFHNCYRNSLDGGRDIRTFSGLYFLLRIIPFVINLVARQVFKVYHPVYRWYSYGTVFFAAALIVALAKPYQKAYMNYLDSLILFDLVLIYYTFLSGALMVKAIMILLAIPILAFIIIMVTKIIVCYAVRPLSKCTCSKFMIRKFVTLKKQQSFVKKSSDLLMTL